MNKRFALWGGLIVALAVIIIIMVRFANDEPETPERNSAMGTRSVEDPGILSVRENDWTKGNPDADVVIVKYSDFQCPACRFFASLDDRLSEELGDDVLFVFRHFPLQNFEFSRTAAKYAEAAGRQGHFWRMHDLIYVNQQRWSRGEAESIFRQFAASLELDMEQFEEDLEDPAISERIESDYRDGQRAGVRAVPTVFINGEPIRTPNSVEAYRELIQSYID